MLAPMIPPPIMTTSAVCAMLSAPPSTSLCHSCTTYCRYCCTLVVKKILYTADRKGTVIRSTDPLATCPYVPHAPDTRELLYMSLPAKNQESSPSMRRVQIRALLQNYKEIPTVPSVVETVTALTADVNCSLAALEAAIKIDQSCVARLLQVANSAFYGSGVNRTVTSVRRAILMFGFNAVQNITLSLTAFDCFRTQNTAEIAMVHAIRLHSVAVATLAQRIAQTCPRDLDPELAYCAGLLHDLERVVLLHLFPQAYHQLLAQCAHARQTDLSKVEFDTFAVTHAVAGQWLGEHWHFPQPILQVIATHHSTQATNPLVATVMLANTLANMYGAGLGGAVRSSSVDSLLRTLGLRPGQTDQYVKYLATELPHLNDIVTYS